MGNNTQGEQKKIIEQTFLFYSPGYDLCESRVFLT